MRPQSARNEVARRIAQVAANQHGAITFEQLLHAGLSPSAVRNRVRAGRLHRIHRGVYALGHVGLSREGIWMAAVLACGAGAVLSHRSAAEHWGMLRPGGGDPQVSVPGRSGRRRRPGITIHRPSTLLTSQTTSRANIPVTKPTRTLLDLRRTAGEAIFRGARRQAEYDRLPLELPTDATRSELETAFLALCRRHRLPAPEVNVRVGPFTVDCLWRQARLVVELDGYRAHGGFEAFETDRARDLDLRARGYTVLRFTWRQVSGTGGAVAQSLRAALG